MDGSLFGLQIRQSRFAVLQRDRHLLHECRDDDLVFDAVISKYVYHNINNASDKQALLKESLRVLKKGGVFVLQDDMKPGMFGDMDAFIKELKAAGYQDVRLIDTAEEIFGSKSRAKLLALGNSAALVGRK